MANEAAPLSLVLGERLKTFREAAGLRQEQVAAEARRFGLRWTRATVAAIELGRRQLSIGELTLLPQILGRAGVWGYDPLPDGNQTILVAGGTTAPAHVMRVLLTDPDGASTATGIETPKPARSRRPSAPTFRLPRAWIVKMRRGQPLVATSRDWHELQLETVGDAEQKAAASLGVPALALALAARHRWGRSLTEERDRKVGNATAPAPKLDPAAAHDAEWPRRLQAIRGHITRALLDELRPLLKDVIVKKRRRAR